MKEKISKDELRQICGGISKTKDFFTFSESDTNGSGLWCIFACLTSCKSGCVQGCTSGLMIPVES
jgi:hypothetical protein